jgi:hypothetical protein
MHCNDLNSNRHTVTKKTGWRERYLSACHLCQSCSPTVNSFPSLDSTRCQEEGRVLRGLGGGEGQGVSPTPEVPNTPFPPAAHSSRLRLKVISTKLKQIWGEEGLCTQYTTIIRVEYRCVLSMYHHIAIS